MLEMVKDRTCYSNRRDQSVLNGCCTAMWKANGKTTILLLFLDSLFPKTETDMRDASSGDKTIQRETTPPIRISRGGGVFLEEISSSRCYNKNDYNEKKKEQHSYKIGTWNVRTVNRGGKLENLQKEMKKNKESVLGVSEV